MRTSENYRFEIPEYDDTADIAVIGKTIENIDKTIKAREDALEVHKNANPIDHPNESVTTEKIKNLNVTEPKLAKGSVTTDKLGEKAVTLPKLGDDVNAKLNSMTSALDTHKSAKVLDHPDKSVTSVKIADKAVGTAQLGDGVVTNVKISDVDASKIKTGTIDIQRLPKAALERMVTVADTAARLKLTQDTVQNGDTVKELDSGKMYLVIDDTKLNTEAGYTVYTAGGASSVPWSGVTDRPSEYNPTAHAEPTGKYGKATGANYGHVMLSDSPGEADSASGGTAVTPKALRDIKTSLEASIGQASGSMGAHAEATATDSVLGHVRLSDSAGTENAASGGKAVTPKALQDVKNELAGKISSASGDAGAHAQVVATDTKLGHITLTDEESQDNAATGGKALTPRALADHGMIFGNDTRYGHVLLTDTPDAEKTAAKGNTAVSPKGLKDGLDTKADVKHKHEVEDLYEVMPMYEGVQKTSYVFQQTGEDEISKKGITNIKVDIPCMTDGEYILQNDNNYLSLKSSYFILKCRQQSGGYVHTLTPVMPDGESGFTDDGVSYTRFYGTSISTESPMELLYCTKWYKTLDERDLEKIQGQVSGGIEGMAPIDHADSTQKYGVGTDTEYGHVKLSDTSDVDHDEYEGTAATPLGVYNAVSEHNDKKGDENTYGHVKLTDEADNAHNVADGYAITPTALSHEIGWHKNNELGTSENYGHVKLSDTASATDTAGPVGGMALSPKALYDHQQVKGSYTGYGHVKIFDGRGSSTQRYNLGLKSGYSDDESNSENSGIAATPYGVRGTVMGSVIMPYNYNNMAITTEAKMDAAKLTGWYDVLDADKFTQLNSDYPAGTAPKFHSNAMLLVLNLNSTEERIVQIVVGTSKDTANALIVYRAYLGPDDGWGQWHLITGAST